MLTRLRFAPRLVQQRRVELALLGLRVAPRPAQQATEGQALWRGAGRDTEASGVRHHTRERDHRRHRWEILHAWTVMQDSGGGRSHRDSMLAEAHIEAMDGQRRPI